MACTVHFYRYMYLYGPGFKSRFIRGSSVADRYHFDADPDGTLKGLSYEIDFENVDEN